MRLLRFAFSALLAMTQRACNDTGANYSILPPLAGGSQREGEFTLTLALSLEGRGSTIKCHCDPDLSGEAISVRGWEEE